MILTHTTKKKKLRSEEQHKLKNLHTSYHKITDLNKKIIYKLEQKIWTKNVNDRTKP
jgi:hypothetical protein